MAGNNRLIYLALGGAGEIGMNTYLYGYGPKDRERFILVDMGVTFPDMESSPGVELIMADPAWIQARADRLEGIFITHAHEDHVGALGLLWPRLKVPVYARRFTAAIAKSKMDRAGQDTTAVRQAAPFPHMVEAGPFRVGFLPVSHSIPESSSLVIDSPAGRILHTADFKIDPTPVVGDPFDPVAFRAVGDSGVKVMTCDSTNVFSTHPGRSEASLAGPIRALMAELAPEYGTGCPVAVVYRASQPDELVLRTTVGELASTAQSNALQRSALILVGRTLNQDNFGQSRLYADDYDRRYRPRGAEPRFPAGTEGL